MRRYSIFSMLILMFALGACTSKEKAPEATISQRTISAILDTLTQRWGNAEREKMEKGINQAAALWRPTDGTEKDFMQLCI
ncbi:MAG: hypothetical protein GX459_13080, partial [Bacteroidales bacterium]|nr:hypothetical protein [Bacteroidales bacterium]